MHVNLLTLVTSLAMGVGTYACRAGGYWLFDRVNPSPAVRALLSYVPGCLFISYVAPAVYDGGPKAWIGAAVAIATMKLTGSMIWPIFTGTAAAWLVWSLA
jgi:uncharacterized membrane protein